ncbi:PWI domain-containing protein, partial [Saitoella complicata NRRL Y-17804]|uniref:PWI domain-containing protein n=1 Tax=Saitoella complicata (strain BCRC 22490 / CBS 7301 / JCM 7358 / NBRC 10748 / NRRL Y-17804) TaxID=698492 RepID=UPI0008670DE4
MSNFRGISLEQDGRFTNAEARLMKTMSFPPEFKMKVDMSKVNLEVIKPWIEDKVIAMMGVEDDVVVDFAVGLLEESGSPDPRKIQISLTGFLEKNAPAFTKELWNLLLSAQDNPTGIPTELIELKKAEMRARK